MPLISTRGSATARGFGFGKRAAGPFLNTITTNQTNLNLATYATSNGWDGAAPAIITIDTGVYVISSSTGTPALTTGAFPGGLTIINKGYIAGKGGSAVVGSGPTGGAAGPSGGNSISLGGNTTIDNTDASAYIGGGGGAGGSSGAGGGGGAGGGDGAPGTSGPGSGGSGGAGGGVGASGSNGTVPSGADVDLTGKGGGSGGGGGGNKYGTKPTSAQRRAGGGGGGIIFPGSGGAGGASSFYGRAGGAGGSSNASGGNSNTSSPYGNTSSLGGAGGGGWGAAGGQAIPFNEPNNQQGSTYNGGSGGKAVELNGYNVTWTSGDTARVYGSVS